MYKKGIPDFPEFKPLDLKDRERLLPYFWQLQPEISDRCFTNLFIWQEFYNIQISQFKDAICIFSANNTTPEKEFFFPPLGQNDVVEALDACFDFMSSRGIRPVVRRASEDFVRIYLDSQNGYATNEDLVVSDYIYRAEDMINLRGRRYHGQRNYIKRFKKKYSNHSIEFLNKQNISECLKFNNEWFNNKLRVLSQKLDIHSDPPPDVIVFLKAETETARKILTNFETLRLTGLAVRIDGRIRAFTIGEKLNYRTALIHIEKADHGYLGLSQFLSQTFCERAWSDCRYINRMEDLGVEGLRKAKLALGPHHMAKKYNITLKEFT